MVLHVIVDRAMAGYPGFKQLRVVLAYAFHQLCLHPLTALLLLRLVSAACRRTCRVQLLRDADSPALYCTFIFA